MVNTSTKTPPQTARHSGDLLRRPRRRSITRLGGAEQCRGRGFVTQQGAETGAAPATKMTEQLGAAGGGGAGAGAGLDEEGFKELLKTVLEERRGME